MVETSNFSLSHSTSKIIALVQIKLVAKFLSLCLLSYSYLFVQIEKVNLWENILDANMYHWVVMFCDIQPYIDTACSFIPILFYI
jgi:hypothetical protein